MEKSLRKRLPGGAFREVSPKRSQTMAAIRGRNNRTTELRLRFSFVRAGISGWILHPRNIPGKPDFFFPACGLALFVDGCFWHGCPTCGHYPKTNDAFWKAKIERNRERDAETTTRLRREGFNVVRFWEHELHQDLIGCVARIRATISNSQINSSA